MNLTNHITMKNLLLIIVALCATVAASAQSPSLEDKIANLEVQVASLQQTIYHLQSQIDDVTKQNLSLKQALHLQPTISECNTDGNLNFRLVSATGNRQKGEITFILSVVNPTRKDILYRADAPYFIDENGKSVTAEYNDYFIAGKNGRAANILPDTPLEIIIKFISNDEPQYAKTLVIPASFGGNDSRFINIPIKWE